MNDTEIMVKIEFTEEEKKCLKCLQRCTQSLIWFNTISTPWLDILGRDTDKLNSFVLKCEEAGILKDLTGYLQGTAGPKMIYSSATIVNFQPAGQMKLFG